METVGWLVACRLIAGIVCSQLCASVPGRVASPFWARAPGCLAKPRNTRLPPVPLANESRRLSQLVEASLERLLLFVLQKNPSTAPLPTALDLAALRKSANERFRLPRHSQLRDFGRGAIGRRWEQLARSQIEVCLVYQGRPGTRRYR